MRTLFSFLVFLLLSIFLEARTDLEAHEVCNSSACENGGVCHNDDTSVRCQCLLGFSGKRCEQVIKLAGFNETAQLLRNFCRKRFCWQKAGDRKCDDECNVAACNYDGGDCSEKRALFANCKHEVMCADQFANGVCNEICNNEDCLYDGMDCMPAVMPCPLEIREKCTARFADGICDSECNTRGCGFDGGDCSNQTESVIYTDIRLVYPMKPEEFQDIITRDLMKLSSRMIASVRIEKDETGPRIFEWNGSSKYSRVEMGKDMTVSTFGQVRHANKVIVHLEFQENCVPGQCLYIDSESVMNMFSALLAKDKIDLTRFITVAESVNVAPKSTRHVSNELTWEQTLGIIVCLILIPCVATWAGLKCEEYEKKIKNPALIPAPEKKNETAQPIKSTNQRGNKYVAIKM